MCDPVTLAIIAGTASAGSSVIQGQAEAKQLERSSERDFAIADQRRDLARAKADRRRREAIILQSSQIARQAAGGGGASGSFLDVVGQSAENVEFDALNILFAGEQEANNFIASGINKKNQAKATKQGSFFGGLASGIGAGATAFGAGGGGQEPKLGD